jgi:siroheme synthase
MRQLEVSMDVRLAAPAQAQPPSSALPAGLVLFIGTGNEGVIAWPALAALAAADAVLHDGALDPQRHAALPRTAFVEAIAAGAAGGRAKKLAAEGWRVVHLVADDPAASPALRAEAEELAVAGIAIRCFAGPLAPASPLPVPAPQPFATALNGLAG